MTSLQDLQQAANTATPTDGHVKATQVVTMEPAENIIHVVNVGNGSSGNQTMVALPTTVANASSAQTTYASANSLSQVLSQTSSNSAPTVVTIPANQTLGGSSGPNVVTVPNIVNSHGLQTFTISAGNLQAIPVSMPSVMVSLFLCIDLLLFLNMIYMKNY